MGSIASSSNAAIIKLNSSWVHQWTRRITSVGPSLLEGPLMCAADGGVVFGTQTYLIRFDASGNETLRRQVLGLGGNATNGMKGGVHDSDFLRFVGFARADALPRNDLVFGKVQIGADTGTYDQFSISEPSAFTISNTAVTETTVAWTEAAGSLTDAAGSMTDSAAGMVATVHTRA